MLVRKLAFLAVVAAPLSAQSPAAPAKAPARAPQQCVFDSSASATGYGAWFGSIPDMTSGGGDGVSLSGVSPGSPAEKSGLTGGDVLIKLGGCDIYDLQSMTWVLRAHRVGDTLQTVVRRGKDAKFFDVVLGTRPGS